MLRGSRILDQLLTVTFIESNGDSGGDTCGQSSLSETRQSEDARRRGGARHFSISHYFFHPYIYIYLLLNSNRYFLNSISISFPLAYREGVPAGVTQRQRGGKLRAQVPPSARCVEGVAHFSSVHASPETPSYHRGSSSRAHKVRRYRHIGLEYSSTLPRQKILVKSEKMFIGEVRIDVCSFSCPIVRHLPS